MIDILTLRKQTPLHLAASAGQLEVCRLLLDLGANIDATDDQGQKPIHVAAQNNFPEVVQLFLKQHPQLVLAYTKVTIFFMMYKLKINRLIRVRMEIHVLT